MPQPEPWVIVHPELRTPGDREFWTSPQMYDERRKRPRYALHEVANCFFGMSPSWLRNHLKIGSTVVDGELIEPLRTDANYRMFRLYDIERVAHALAVNNVITGQHLELVVTVVKTNARLYNYLV